MGRPEFEQAVDRGLTRVRGPNDTFGDQCGLGCARSSSSRHRMRARARLSRGADFSVG